MKPGLVSITFRRLEAQKILRLAAESGLSGIEWGGDVHVPHGDFTRAEEVGRMTRDAGLEVASYGSYYAFAECDGENLRQGPSIEAVLDTAEALGAPAVRIWAGDRSPSETSAKLRERIVERCRTIAEQAEEKGLRLDFEFHENTLTETAASTLDLLKEVGHPAVRTLWQPPLQTPPPERLAGLELVRPSVTNVHCNYFAQDAWPHAHALDEGGAEWASYLTALEQEPEERWILIEHVRHHNVEALQDRAIAAFQEDAATLLHWLKRE